MTFQIKGMTANCSAVTCGEGVLVWHN